MFVDFILRLGILTFSSFLLAACFEESSKDQMRLHAISGDWDRSIEIATKLRDPIGKFDSSYDDSLWECSIRAGRVDVVRRLIRLGADVNYQNSSGETGLVIAIRNNRIEMYRFLVALNADRAIRDDRGRGADDWIKVLGRNWDPKITRGGDN